MDKKTIEIGLLNRLIYRIDSILRDGPDVEEACAYRNEMSFLEWMVDAIESEAPIPDVLPRWPPRER